MQNTFSISSFQPLCFPRRSVRNVIGLSSAFRVPQPKSVKDIKFVWTYSIDFVIYMKTCLCSNLLDRIDTLDSEYEIMSFMVYGPQSPGCSMK